MLEGADVGAYRLIRPIGAGGMGEVWLAEHAMLGRRAAIKVLHPMFSGRPDIVTRFFNEARAATAISDPGIVQIFDFGQHTDGSGYIVMELLEGEPLADRLGREGPLAIGDALRILRQVASSLGAAHAAGIVHRDLKPENIFLVRDAEVAGGERTKLLDFGIAKLVDDTGGLKTETSMVMGTPTYMSPEQCRGAGQVDQRADVYSLGCVAFTLVTGAPPFVAAGAGELIAMHLREAPPVPSSHAASVPPEVDALILRCLAKDPAERFSSGAELATAIEALIGTDAATPRQIVSPVARPVATASPQTTLSGAAAMSTPLRRVHDRRGKLVGIIAGLAVVAIGVGAWVMREGKAARAPATSPIDASLSSAAVEVVGDADPNAGAEARLVEARMTAVLGAFPRWAAEHAGAACPDVNELATALAALDAWGRAMVVTCTDQPANQQIGVVSAGPDGTLGTADDVLSWQLAREVTDAARGARWVAAPSPLIVKKRPIKPATPVTPQRPDAGPPTKPAIDLDGDGIPDKR